MASLACAPTLKQIYPVPGVGEQAPIDEVLNQLDRNERIRVQISDGRVVEAVFCERISDKILVNEMVRKGQVVGSKIVKSDEVQEIAVSDLEQVFIYRTSTAQYIGYGVAGVVFVSAVYTMTSTKEE